MTPNRMLKFVLMTIFQLAFGLTKSGLFSLLFSRNAEKIKNYIEDTDENLPGGSTGIKKMRLVLEKCELTEI